MDVSASAPALSDDQLRELVGLMKGADSVELKLSVPDEDRRSTVVALGMDALDAFIRQVYFFDTPELDLDRAGVVVRARRTQGKPDDSVVKLRPVVPSDLSPELRSQRGFGVEVDALPGGYVCSASFKHKHDSSDVVKPAVAGDGRLSKMFSKPDEGFQVAAETRAYLAGRGVNLFGEQETKTRTALEFFAREAREG